MDELKKASSNGPLRHARVVPFVGDGHATAHLPQCRPKSKTRWDHGLLLCHEVAFRLKSVLKFDEGRPWQPEMVEVLLSTVNAVFLHGLVELVLRHEAPIRAVTVVLGVLAGSVGGSPSFSPGWVGRRRAFVLRFRRRALERIQAQITSEEVEPPSAFSSSVSGS